MHQTRKILQIPMQSAILWCFRRCVCWAIVFLLLVRARAGLANDLVNGLSVPGVVLSSKPLISSTTLARSVASAASPREGAASDPKGVSEVGGGAGQADVNTRGGENSSSPTHNDGRHSSSGNSASVTANGDDSSLSIAVPLGGGGVLRSRGPGPSTGPATSSAGGSTVTSSGGSAAAAEAQHRAAASSDGPDQQAGVSEADVTGVLSSAQGTGITSGERDNQKADFTPPSQSGLQAKVQPHAEGLGQASWQGQAQSQGQDWGDATQARRPWQSAPVGPSSPQRCVVILATGRSGSTSLADALNQLPNYLIRGEQEASFWYLFLAWRMLQVSWLRSREYRNHVKALTGQLQQQEQQQQQPSPPAASAAYEGYSAVKEAYHTFALQKKLPWFNDLHPDRVRDALRAFYTLTYGYHGPGVVSGFKEIRFVRGRAFQLKETKYEDFVDFVQFLRLMCDDLKVLLNSRASAAVEDNAKLAKMLTRGKHLESEKTFASNLRATHYWYDRYAGEHPDHAFRVHMEDMFDPQKNATLVRELLRFLGEEPSANITFDRMPTWEDSAAAAKAQKRTPGKRSSRGGMSHRSYEPWLVRRRRLLMRPGQQVVVASGKAGQGWKDDGGQVRPT